MKRTVVALLCVTALGILWTLAPKASADSNDLTTWTFTPVDVPLPNVTQTIVRDMNQAGQIVGHYLQPGVGHRGFLLHNGVFTTGIAARVPGNTQPRGINPQGGIVGTVVGGGLPFRAFLLSQGVFTEFGYPGASYTIAEDIDAPGDIVGYYGLGTPAVDHGFAYRDGVFTTIDVPGALWTTVRGINPEGEMVGVYQAVDPDGASRPHGFLRRKDGSFTTINGPGVKSGSANGINPLGQIVGEYTVPGGLPRLGYLLSGGSYTTIMYPGAARTRPFKITPDGQHIVGFYDDLHGFVLSRKPLE